MSAGVGPFAAWFFRLMALVLIWSYVFHAIAGLRHLWMDLTHSVSREFGRNSAVLTIALSSVLTLAFGAMLFF